MIHGYHVILPMYGFRLPNDPRGSWSEFVRRWELARFGQATKGSVRREIAQLTDSEVRQREAAKLALMYPAELLQTDCIPWQIMPIEPNARRECDRRVSGKCISTRKKRSKTPSVTLKRIHLRKVSQSRDGGSCHRSPEYQRLVGRPITE